MGDHEATLLNVYGIPSRDEQWNCPECGLPLYRGNPATGYDPTQHVSTFICSGKPLGAYQTMGGNWQRHKCDCGYVISCDGFGDMVRVTLIGREE